MEVLPCAYKAVLFGRTGNAKYSQVKRSCCSSDCFGLMKDETNFVPGCWWNCWSSVKNIKGKKKKKRQQLVLLAIRCLIISSWYMSMCEYIWVSLCLCESLSVCVRVNIWCLPLWLPFAFCRGYCIKRGNSSLCSCFYKLLQSSIQLLIPHQLG